MFFDFTMVSRDDPFRQWTEYLAMEALYVKISTYFITSLSFEPVHVLISVINFLSLSTLIFMIKVKGMEGVKTRTKSICWLKIILHNNTKSRHFKKSICVGEKLPNSSRISESYLTFSNFL